MLINKDIIIVSIQPWDINLGSNSKDIATELSKNNRVLYVNEPLNSRARYFQKKSPYVAQRIKMLKHSNKGIEPKNPNLTIFYPQKTIPSINFIPFKKIFKILNKKNNAVFASEIKEVIKQLKFKNYILIIDSSIFNGYYLKELLKPSAMIYYIRDNLVVQPYFKRHGARLEPRLIEKADLVASNSDELIEYTSQYNPKSYNIGQGSDVSMFDYQRKDLQLPPEIKTIPAPIIGYEGFLSSCRLDISLIKYLAEKRPEWQLVFVGPLDNEFKLAGLEKYKNIHLLGWKKLKSIPNYVHRFNVCINPQLVNQHTLGNNPRKVMEYLAMGKPVVGTHTKAMEKFKEICFLANCHEKFLEHIESALAINEDRREQYRNFAMKNGWDLSIKLLGDALNKNTNPEK